MSQESVEPREGGAPISRRQFVAGLFGAAAGLALAACAPAAPAPTLTPPAKGVPTPAVAATPTKAPAVLKGTKLSILQGSYFVPEAQKLFTDQAKEWGAANGVEVTTDYINWPDLQAKVAAAIQGGSGPDIVQLWWFWPALYADHLVDVSDVADAVGAAGGGYYEPVKQAAFINGKWLAVPMGGPAGMMNYRISYLKEAGADKFPDTWEELFKVGKKLKAMGKPIGQALGHSLGDPYSFVYPYMWSYGGLEVQSDGKTVAINSKEMVDALSMFVGAWKDAFDEAGLSWDDTSNNRAFLTNQISVSQNGDSIYLAALKQAPDIVKDMDHAYNPAGPKGRYHVFAIQEHGVFKYSKNVEGAKEFLKWWMQDAQYGKWLRIQKAYQTAPTLKWEKDPMWTEDPKLTIFGTAMRYLRLPGYAGPPDAKAAEAMAKFVIVDMYANAVKTGDAKGAVAGAETLLKQIYSK